MTRPAGSTVWRTEMPKTKNSDLCVGCGSENLYSTHVDADGLAVTEGDGDRYATFCNECGTEQP